MMEREGPQKELAGKALHSKIVLGLITCRNPTGLRKLLMALTGDDLKMISRIIVVDNDIGRAGLGVCEEIKKAKPELNIEGFIEHQPGISFARNRILHEALSAPFEYVAMLDDDEFPESNWLGALHQCATEEGADIVGGPVIPVLEIEPPYPILQDDYSHMIKTNVRNKTFIGASGNILLSHRVVKAFHRNWFLPDYALTGGEDLEFLSRTLSAGFVHSFAPNAIVREDISLARINVDWLAKRAFRSGNSLARVRIKQFGWVKATLIESFNIIGLLLQVATIRLRPAVSDRAKFLAQLKINRIRGKIEAFRGKFYYEYDRSIYR